MGERAQLDRIWKLYGHGHELLVDEGAADYHEQLPGFGQAFDSNRSFVSACCMDERVPDISFRGITMRTPGSLIAMPFEEAMNSIRHIFVGYHGEKVLRITSHVHCGAGTILYHKEHPGHSDADPGTIDRWVDKVTREFTRKANEVLNKEGIRVEYIGQVDIVGDPTHHHAFCAYYVATPVGFSTTRVPGVLPGFIISAGYYDKKLQAIDDVLLAVSIAFGSHGFKDRFTEKRPFMVVGMTDSRHKESSVKTVQSQLEEALSNLVPYQEGRIKVDVFTPSYQSVN